MPVNQIAPAQTNQREADAPQSLVVRFEAGQPLQMDAGHYGDAIPIGITGTPYQLHKLTLIHPPPLRPPLARHQTPPQPRLGLRDKPGIAHGAAAGAFGFKPVECHLFAQ